MLLFQNDVRASTARVTVQTGSQSIVVMKLVLELALRAAVHVRAALQTVTPEVFTCSSHSTWLQ